jgi:hypothetical protein
MSLSDLAAIGSFISGLAVVITLLFLLIQMRQTERNQRALLNQGALSRTTDTVMWQSQRELSVLSNRVGLNETNFSNEELWKLLGLLRVNVLNLQDALVQHKQRLVDQATLEQAVRAFEFWMRRPVMRGIYRLMRENIATDTRLYIDQLIDALPLGEPLDLKAALQAQLEK